MKTKLFVLFTFLPFFLFSQQEIELINPSFEDFPIQGSTPRGWINCGFKGETPPDVHDSDPRYSFFGVTQEAYDGKTYLGMVTRDNYTWESVGTRLPSLLVAGVQYEFSIALCRAEWYESLSRKSRRMANYTRATILRVWGGDEYCEKTELFGETELVNNTDWLDYLFVFQPTSDYQFLLLEVCYDPNASFPYNGNILVDFCSPIVPLKNGRELLATKEETLSTTTEEQFSTGLLELIGEETALEKETVRTSAPHSGILYYGYQFQKHGMSHLRQWVLSNPYDFKIITIKCLEILGATKTAQVVKEVVAIHQKNLTREPISEKEVEYFEYSEEIILEKASEENLQEKLILYLNRHEKAVQKELRKGYY